MIFDIIRGTKHAQEIDHYSTASTKAKHNVDDMDITTNISHKSLVKCTAIGFQRNTQSQCI